MSVIDDSSASGFVAISTAEPRDYLALVKPRVMQLVVVTALAGILLAPHPVNFVIGFASLLCIAVGAGASGALNMWYDSDIDAVMRRTSKRPIRWGALHDPRHWHSASSLRASRSGPLCLVANLLARRFARLHDLLLHRHLYDVAQAFDAAEHCHRWCGRRAAANRRLCGRDWSYRRRTARFVRPHLHVDAAAFLGLGAGADDRLRQSRRADDAQRQGRRPHAARDPDLQRDPRRRRCSALCAWLRVDRLRIIALGLGVEFLRRAIRVFRVRDGEAANKTAMGLFWFSIVYLYVLFAEILIERLVFVIGVLR